MHFRAPDDHWQQPSAGPCAHRRLSHRYLCRNRWHGECAFAACPCTFRPRQSASFSAPHNYHPSASAARYVADILKQQAIKIPEQKKQYNTIRQNRIMIKNRPELTSQESDASSSTNVRACHSAKASGLRDPGGKRAHKRAQIYVSIDFGI